MRITMRKKMVAGIFIPLLVVYSLMIVIEYSLDKSHEIEHTKTILRQAANAKASDLGIIFSSVSQAAKSTADFMSVGSKLPGRNEIQLILERVYKSSKWIDGASISFEPGFISSDSLGYAFFVFLGNEGTQFVEVNTNIYEYRNSDWYLIPALTKEPSWSDPYFQRARKAEKLMCTYSVPFFREGKFAGIVSVDINIGQFREEFSREISDIRFFVVSGSGAFVYHTNEDLIMSETIFSIADWYNRPDIALLGREMISGKSGVQKLMDPLDRQVEWYVYTPIPSTGWSFVTILTDEHVMKPVHRSIGISIMVMLLVLLIIFLIIEIFSLWVSRPVMRLASAAKKVADGDLNVQIKNIKTHDELGELAETFNYMVNHLRENIQARMSEVVTRQSIEKELQIARKIQESLLPMTSPQFPVCDELQIEAEYRPAEIMAGDFYDFWKVDEDTIAFVIADVSSSGVQAAMIMAVTRALVRVFAGPDVPPQQVAKKLNKALIEENKENMYVTKLFGYYKISKGTIEFINAAHSPPIILSTDGLVRPIEKDIGTVLGILENIEFTSQQIQLQVGETLVMFTDGLPEAENNKGELFGIEGIRQYVSGKQGQPVKTICEGLIETVEKFRAGNRPDDITAVVMRRVA